MTKKSIATLMVTGAMILGLSACGMKEAVSDSTTTPTQSTDTPAVTAPVDTSTPEIGQTAPDMEETAPVSQTETEQDASATPQTQEETPAPEETPISEEAGPQFTEVNQIVYATTSVNVRSGYSTDSDRIGGLSYGASATRTGIGDNGWSRIVYGDSVAYVNSNYLTTTKPSISSTSGAASNSDGGNGG